MPDRIQLIATKEHYFDGRTIREGEQFPCESRFVDIQLKLGRARLLEARSDEAGDPPAPQLARSQTYSTRHLTAKNQGPGAKKKGPRAEA